MELKKTNVIKIKLSPLSSAIKIVPEGLIVISKGFLVNQYLH